MMNIACIPNLVGGHLGGWRHKDAFDRPVMNLEAFIEMCQIAERGKFDCVFLADGNGVRDRPICCLVQILQLSAQNP